ncbi:EF-hand domain-containing protein [Actinokineospora bangkokensis]|uniref:EF-hand domain-containing protein n=1 Tax=Actinokineospora bangkokensis TaxID=1193682 RepID=A0A1Q9LIC9_9PSEU|nr:EF-hand domain-containing protein [Actinokineospora bangkokensis]OLR91739.1 hypothetical protein BJP25_24720 [Actinokineospora bangkokensis]
MPTAIQETKLQRLFGLLDADGNGYLEEDDFELFAAKAVRAAGAGDSLEARIVKREAAALWRALSDALDADGDLRIGRDEFLRAADIDDVVDGAVKLGVAVRDVVDVDGDGLISESEWVSLDAQLGITRTESAAGFAAIDADGDGFVSKPEYAAAVAQFFRGAEEGAPGNWVFGRF